MNELYDNITAEQENIFTLADATEEYLTERQIFNEKYYPSYFRYAANAWSEIFIDTLFVFNGRWLPVKLVNGVYTVSFPKDCKGFISANVKNNCNLIKRVPYNSSVNVIPKPNPHKYTCEGIISSFVTTTKYLFTSGGKDYYEKQYLQYCPNGDIVENTQTPVKKYLDYIGDTAGDYNNDHGNDYSHDQEAFGNFEIVTETTQRILANLDTEEDGCPKNTESNIDKIVTCCGCYSNLVQNCCDIPPVYDAMDIGVYGCVTLNEGRTGLVYTPPSNYNNLCSGAIPDYLMVYFRGSANGNEVTGAAVIPDDFYIRNALTLGIDWYSVRLSRNMPEKEKQFYRARFEQSLNEIVRSKFNMNLQTLVSISEIKTTW